MSHRCRMSVGVAAIAAGSLVLAPALAQAQDDAPRTAWGRPDLQGVWDFRSITPLERPEDLADREFLTEEEAAQIEQGAVDRDVRLWEQGPRRTEAGGNVGGYNNFWMDRGLRAVETRRTSLITYPPNGRMPAMPPAAVHTARIVPLDGRPRLDPNVKQWSGDSRGRWEGDTLVIETRNFDAGRRWRNTTDSARLVERLTRVDADTLNYEFTVTDPVTWTSPWTASVPLALNPEPMYEYACHEGNYSMPLMLAGQRNLELSASDEP